MRETAPDGLARVWRSTAPGAVSPMPERMGPIRILLDQKSDTDTDRFEPRGVSAHSVALSHAPRSCQTPKTAKLSAAMNRVGLRVCRWLRWFALLTAAGGLLASCDTPVGVSPALKGTYWQNAVVTNPDGGGPQVVRWGPPQPTPPIPGGGGR